MESQPVWGGGGVPEVLEAALHTHEEHLVHVLAQQIVVVNFITNYSQIHLTKIHQ
jgi:hypothetical protein